MLSHFMMLILCSSRKKISNEFIIEHLRGNGLDNLYTMYVKYTKHAGVYTLKFDKKKDKKRSFYIIIKVKNGMMLAHKQLND